MVAISANGRGLICMGCYAKTIAYAVEPRTSTFPGYTILGREEKKIILEGPETE
jgi:hypothetical protein